MPSNLLLLLPLLGGYGFIHASYRWRYRGQSLSGHRLVFEAAIFGLLFVPLARLLILPLRRFDRLAELWWTYSGGTPLLGTVVLTVVLALVAGPLWNYATVLSPDIVSRTWRELGSRPKGSKPWKRLVRDVRTLHSLLLEASREGALAKAVEGSG